jgi:hypothetical protein
MQAVEVYVKTSFMHAQAAGYRTSPNVLRRQGFWIGLPWPVRMVHACLEIYAVAFLDAPHCP